MKYEKMWNELQKHLLETIEKIDTYDTDGLFAVAGMGNAITAMIVIEDKHKGDEEVIK